MNERNILVIGGANSDLVTRVPRCPKPGESLIGYSFSKVSGGKGANQAVAAARLGASTSFAGCVGDDVFGDALHESLAKAGVDVTHLQHHPHEPTGTAVILVGDDGQNTIALTPAANLCLQASDVRALESVFRAAEVLLIQLEIPLPTVAAALEMARQCNTVSILDAGPAQPLDDDLLKMVDVLSPNETEAEALTGHSVTTLDSARDVAERLRDRGVGEVVLKLGSQGAYYLGEEEIHVPAFNVDAIDSVAAGDAFTAALALNWNRCSVAEALRFGNAAGALATTKEGAMPSMPTRDALNAFLAEKGSTS